MKFDLFRENPGEIYCCLGLGVIGLLTILYTIFYRYFAQVHIQLPFLNFPIFVGEQALFVCAILLLLRWKVQPPENKKIYWVLIVYFAWLLWKAIEGYIDYGPHAFRNAALFYYPLFAVFGYYFYQRKLFKNQPIVYGFLILCLVLFKIKIYTYYRFPILFFYFILATQVRNRWAKIIFLLLFVALFNFYDVVLGSRSYLLGMFVSVIFLWINFIFVSVRNKSKIGFLFIFSSILIFLSAMIYLGDRNRLQSFYKFDGTVAWYKKNKGRIANEGKDFVFTPRAVKVYSPDSLGVTGDEMSRMLNATIKNLDEHTEEVYTREAKNAQAQTGIESLQENQTSAPPKQVEPVSNVQDTKPQILPKKVEPVSNVQDTKPQIPSKKVEIVSIVLDHNPRRLPQKTESAPQIQPEAHFTYYVDPVIIERNFVLLLELVNPIIKEATVAVRTNTVNINNVVPKVYAKVEVVVDEVMEKLTGELKASILQKNPQITQMDELEKILVDEQLFKHDVRLLRVSISKMADMAIHNELGTSLDQWVQKGVDESNILFRLFIWEDMISDMIREKALWGINFGKPQRSRQIEILEWGKEEYVKDGFIAPHNSYLHGVYRAGIVGMVLIITQFVLFWRMVKIFIQTNSIIGILLTGILAYFMAIAFFLVYYEFPYSAIPFWSLYGMTLAYAVEKRKQGAAGEIKTQVIQ